MNAILFLTALTAVAQQPAPTLAEEVRTAVASLQPTLPIRQGPVTITRIEAQGVNIVFQMQVPGGGPDFERRFREALPVEACKNEQARAFFARGGRYVYHVQAPAIPMFMAQVDHC